MDQHAFISYVHEDKEAVDRIQRILEAAGIPVWRDTDALWPGEDWKQKIRQAVTGNALVFLACFSDESVGKETSYQREELLLAIEQFRLRNPEEAWLIPIRLSDCSLPSFDLGAGRTLDSLQRVELFGGTQDEGQAKLVAGVLRVAAQLQTPRESAVASPPRTNTRDVIKKLLFDETRQIELEDEVLKLTENSIEQLNDVALFPSDSERVTNDLTGLRFLGDQARRYFDVVSEVAEVFAVAGTWGLERHAPLWMRAMNRVTSTAKDGSGKVLLLELRRLPLLVLLYVTGLASVHRRNYSALRAVGADARVRTLQGPVPVFGAVNSWVPFANSEMAAQVLVLEEEGVEVTTEIFEALRTGRKGKRYTPVSDLLHLRLRERLRAVIPDDDEYTETFDELEVLLGAIALDIQMHAAKGQAHVYGPAFGAFTWRDRYSDPNLEARLLLQSQAAKESWPPVEAGLFGGSSRRAISALEKFVETAADVRHRRF